MKNKEVKAPKEIRLPELDIHGVWWKIINWIGHIPPHCWIIIVVVFLSIALILIPHNIWISFLFILKAQGILTSMILIFSLVALSLVWSTGQRIDVSVLMYFNMYGKRSHWLDLLMLGFTQIGNGIFAMVIAVILFLIGAHLLAYELILGTLTLWLVVETMKIIFHRTRPYIKLKGIRIVGSRASGRSFPSGHTSQTFFMATFALHYYHVSLYVTISLYAIGLLVGITRIYVGMHYPRDVLGGAILGTSWGLFTVIINNYIWK